MPRMDWNYFPSTKLQFSIHFGESRQTTSVICAQNWNWWLPIISQKCNLVCFETKYSISLVSLLSWLAFSYFGGKGNAAVARAVRTEPQLGQTSKTRKTLDFKNREINGAFLCLQRFDKFWICSARNDRKRKLYEFSETCKKKFVKSVWVNLF